MYREALHGTFHYEYYIRAFSSINDLTLKEFTGCWYNYLSSAFSLYKKMSFNNETTTECDNFIEEHYHPNCSIKPTGTKNELQQILFLLA